MELCEMYKWEYKQWYYTFFETLEFTKQVSNMMKRKLRDVEKDDFSVVVKFMFPAKGTPQTPSHNFADFEFKDYCPLVFRHIRKRFFIQEEDYIFSLCGKYSLTMLPTPGKSGALFFCARDGRFLLKTITKAEANLLLKILPHYYKVYGMENIY